MIEFDPDEILKQIKLPVDSGEMIMTRAAVAALTQLINTYMMAIASTETASGRAEAATRFLRGVKLWKRALRDVVELLNNSEP